MTPEDFRRLGHRLVDWVADYRTRIATFPVMSPVAPGDVKRHFPSDAPRKPQPPDALLKLLDEAVLPGITHWNHPRFFAYFPANSSLASVLADIVCAGLGVQGMSWQTSPAATEVEEVMVDWLRRLVGLPDTFTGVIQDTASTATLVSLLCARERATGFGQRRGGLFEEKVPLTIYCSREAHSSVEKAVRLAGFGVNHLRAIATDDAYAMRPEELARTIAEDVAAGRRPCAIVASVGTTATTAVDPIPPLVELARTHRMWLHVDAAMAGTAMLLPECQRLWAGVEAADSVVMNPHKWMGTGFDLSVYFVRDAPLLIETMSTQPSYLRTTQDGQVKNFRDWGIPLGRRFRALKMWFLLHLEGVESIQARLRRDLANARWLAEQVDAASDWERMAPVPLQTVCLRHRPAGMSEEALNAHNLALAQRVNADGCVYLTPSVVQGKGLIRVSVGAEGTERADVAAVWEKLREHSVSP